MDKNVYSFTDSEIGYMVDLLRAVYEIRTIDGEQDFLLQDFLVALENADCIEIGEDTNEI